MCNCTSCEYTDSFRDKGFAAWPRGNPTGERRSSIEYTAHVHASRRGETASVAFTPGQKPIYPWGGTAYALPRPSKLVVDFITRSYQWSDRRNALPGPNAQRRRTKLRKAA